MIYINLLIIILLIIFIHELGHYFAARLFKVKVTDFSIGFGRPIYQFIDKNNTNWKISLIPLGGYVKIKGLDTIFQKNLHQEYEIGTFQSLSLIKKIIILLAGSCFNIISAFIILFLICFFIGSSKHFILSPEFLPKVAHVYENSAADVNDIQKGDYIKKINGKNIKFFSEISKQLKDNYISLEIIRNNNIIFKEFNLLYNKDYNKYIIGIGADYKDLYFKKFDLIYSLKSSFNGIKSFYYFNFLLLKNSYINNTLSSDLAGPIGIVKNANMLMIDNIEGILFIFIFFSLAISLFNLFPIPLLDGGHIVYFIIRSIFSNSLPHIITRIYLVIGIAILSFLFFIVTFNDIFYK
jgi:regulator of sigma E protease|tara:strand:- start:169 stop:1224 length:1056 start_codon:yes stop_codon:yes gene_type:complete